MNNKHLCDSCINEKCRVRVTNYQKEGITILDCNNLIKRRIIEKDQSKFDDFSQTTLFKSINLEESIRKNK